VLRVGRREEFEKIGRIRRREGVQKVQKVRGRRDKSGVV
jgi:hypothetical protein